MPIAGSTVLLAVTFRASPDGPPVDATDVTLTITAAGAVVHGPVTPLTLTKVGVGRYEYPWQVPFNGAAATYTAAWSGVLPGDTHPTVGYETVTVGPDNEGNDADDTSLVSTDELRDYMSGIGLDADQAGAMQDVLDGLQRELERHCQRRFTVRSYVESIYPDEFGRLWPKHTPVLDVLEPAGYVAAGNQMIGQPVSVFGGAYAPVLVRYVAGLNPDDAADVRSAILRVAAREATTRHDDVLNVNDLTARHVDARDAAPLGWTPDELARFDRLRRRTVA